MHTGIKMSMCMLKASQFYMLLVPVPVLWVCMTREDRRHEEQ